MPLLLLLLLLLLVLAPLAAVGGLDTAERGQMEGRGAAVDQPRRIAEGALCRGGVPVPGEGGKGVSRSS